jgi:putative transposase
MLTYNCSMMTPDTTYHMFNRGNQKQLIFRREKNYRYFLDKIKATFLAGTDVLAYCLMPNHFHLMIHTNPDFDYSSFSKRLGKMLSSYTRGLQNQDKFVGSLFQQNTKKKILPGFQEALNCFQYIHQNPLKANLVTDLEIWPYSSFNEYLHSTPAICNIKLGRSLLDLPSDPLLFYRQSKEALTQRQ